MDIQNTKTAEILKGLIFALTLMGGSVFFAVYALLGMAYEGSESSPAYIIFMVSLFILEAYIFLRGGRFKPIELKWLLVPIAFVALAGFFSLLYRQELNTTIIRNVILWQYMGIFLAFNINKTKVDAYIENFLVVLMFVVTLGSVINVLTPFFRGDSLFTIKGYSLVGSSFQAQSYHTATAIGVNLFFFFANAKRILTKVIAYILLGIQFLCVILYAGRGGMLLALVYLIAFFFYSNRGSKITIRRLFKGLLYTLLLVILYIFVSSMISSSSVLQARFNRVFSYIGSEGLDLTQTSNRDSVYLYALEYVADSPIIGYGILGYMYLENLARYPHDIFLEFLIEGGIVYLIVWACLVIKGIKRIRLFKDHIAYRFFLVFFISAFTKLLFSGSYSYSMGFWFSLVFSWVCSRETTAADSFMSLDA